MSRCGIAKIRGTAVGLLLAVSLLLAGCVTAPFDEAGIYYEYGQLVRAVTTQAASNGVPRVVVGEFLTPAGELTALGRLKQSEFISRTLGVGALKVVERRELERAIQETQYNINQVLRRPEDVPEIGQFLPAHGIVVATISLQDDYLRLDLRIFSTDQGVVVAAATGLLYIPEEEYPLYQEIIP